MKTVKFLADVNVEKGIVDYLAQNGFDVKWVPDYDCSLADDELLKLANNEKRILITNDKDFGELVFLQKKLATGIILLRVKGQITKTKIKLIRKLLLHYSNKLTNSYIVLTENNIRIIHMEILS